MVLVGFWFGVGICTLGGTVAGCNDAAIASQLFDKPSWLLVLLCLLFCVLSVWGVVSCW